MDFYAVIVLWIVVAQMGALIIGSAAGVLSWLDNGRVPRAILVGGSAAGGTITIAVAMAALLK